MKKQHGFSMIEVLVAVVVLVFGVLGMAGLQMQAINATEQGRYNSRAAMQATSIAAAIKANPSYWSAPPSALITVQGATVTNGPGVFTGDCTSGTFCTGAQMAYYDLSKIWGPEIATSLPVGKFTILCNLTVSPSVCAVTVLWKEKNVAGRSQDTTGTGSLATGATSDHSYQTLVSSL